MMLIACVKIEDLVVQAQDLLVRLADYKIMHISSPMRLFKTSA